MIATIVKTALLLLPWLALAQSPAPSPEIGKAVYRSNCAFCHGLDGKGGRGPNLVSAPLNHGDTDEDIAVVVRKGVPGSSMPAFSSMEPLEMKSLISFLHQLAGTAPRARVKVGDAAAGKAVYANSGCAGCHRVNAQGSAYGPDLSRIGVSRSVEYLRQSLVDPSADIPPEYEGVSVTTKTGEKVTGVRANEDTFSVQVREPSQSFRSFFKSELRAVDFPKTSLMPSYARLSPGDLNNLIEYLLSLRGGAAGDTKKAEGIR